MMKLPKAKLSKVSAFMKSLSSKLSNLKPYKSQALAVVSGLLLVGFITRAPELHKALIRSYVGSKVLMLTNVSGNSGGTGFLVKAPSGRTFIVTNSHVCNLPGKELFAELDGRVTKLKIREISRLTDLCLLEQPGSRSGLNLANSLDIGDQVEILGHPRLFPLTSSSGEYTGNLYDVIIPLMEGFCPDDLEGPNVSGTMNTMFGPVDVCALRIPVAGISSAKSLGGNSGSPVVDWKGSVVGVVFGGIQDNNDALIVPLKDLEKFLKPY